MADTGSAPARPQPQAVDEPPPAMTRVRNAAVEIATTAVLAVVIYLVVQTFVVQTYQIHQQSMVPSLRPGQHLLVDKLTPRFDDYSRGDVVVFHPPGEADDETPFIKRVIGVPGDSVELIDGRVSVNGVQLEEPYLANDAETVPESDEEAWEIAAGQLFLMGDNRNASDDSRRFGPVPIESVIGRAWLRFWPLDTLTILNTPTYSELSPAP